MMDDPVVIAAALAGAVVGVLLMRRANAQDRADRARSEPPATIEPRRVTHYARRPASSAAPVLLAVGLALAGIGLAFGSGDDGIDARLLLPGAAVLLAAVVATLRGGRDATQPDGPASAGHDDSVPKERASQDDRERVPEGRAR